MSSQSFKNHPKSHFFQLWEPISLEPDAAQDKYEYLRNQGKEIFQKNQVSIQKNCDTDFGRNLASAFLRCHQKYVAFFCSPDYPINNVTFGVFVLKERIGFVLLYGR